MDRIVPVNNTLKYVLKHRIKSTSSEYVLSNSEGRELTHLARAFKSAVEDMGFFRMEGGKKV